MQEYQEDGKNSRQSNLFSVYMFRFLPYWPLFLLLFLVCGFGAYLFMRYVEPKYDITASLLIRDEKKGADESKALEAINIYNSKKIVENETEILHSHTLMVEVVNNLHLYAPIFEYGRIQPVSAYISSPVDIEAEVPEAITSKGPINISMVNNMVKADGHVYELGKWVMTPWGKLRFNRNENQRKKPERPLYFNLIPQKKVVDELLTALDVNAVNKLSSVVTLKITDAVPERGENILNELIKAYENAEIKDKNILAGNTLAFIENRMKFVVKDLDSIETSIQKLKSRKGIVDLSEQGKMFLENVSENDKKVTDLNMRLSILDQVEKYVMAKDGEAGISPSTIGIDDNVLTQLLQRLFDAQTQYQKQLKTTPEGNPLMFSLKNEMDHLKGQILENIQNLRVSMTTSRNDINASNGAYTSVLQSLPAKEHELLEVSRQQAIKNDAYAFLLQKREETALSYASTVADSRTVDMAVASLLPTSPKKILVYGIAFALAFFLGVLSVSLKEMLNNKILFRSEIESLVNVPIVGEIVRVRTKKGLVVNNPKYSFVADQFHQLRVAAGLYGVNVKKMKLLVTSSITKEGKSFVTANLALSLAYSGKKVIVLDMDLRNPRTSAVFGMKDSEGMAEVLEGKLPLKATIRPTEYNNLSLIPAGFTDVNPTELFLNGNFKEIFLELEQRFDYILVDSAPVDPVIDAYVLSRYCDATLFIVRHNVTPKAMIQMIVKDNEIKALKKMYVVFNGVKPRGFFTRGFGYGYGYGYKKFYGKRIIKS